MSDKTASCRHFHCKRSHTGSCCRWKIRALSKRQRLALVEKLMELPK